MKPSDMLHQAVNILDSGAEILFPWYKLFFVGNKATSTLCHESFPFKKCVKLTIFFLLCI